MGDGGQPLHVAAEDPADRRGLGLAQLGELVGDVGDRAVLLAQLLPHDGKLAHGRDVALVGEHPGQRLGGRQVGLVGDHVGEALLDERHPPVGEGADRVVAARLGQEPERLQREVVVLLVEAVAAGVGDREHLGRPAPAATGAVGSGVARLDGHLGHQVVEMAAYGGGSQVEPGSQSRSGRGALLEDRPGHPLTGRLPRRGSNSTTSVCRYCLAGSSKASPHSGPDAAATNKFGAGLRFARHATPPSHVARRENLMRIFSSGRYAAVTSTLALVVAVGGASYAAVEVTGDDITNGTVTTKDVKNKTLKYKDIAAEHQGASSHGCLPVRRAPPVPPGPLGATAADRPDGPSNVYGRWNDNATAMVAGNKAVAPLGSPVSHVGAPFEGPQRERRHHGGDQERPDQGREHRVLQRPGGVGGGGRAVAPEHPDGLDQGRDRVPLGDRAQHGRHVLGGREGVGQEGQREDRGEHHALDRLDRAQRRADQDADPDHREAPQQQQQVGEHGLDEVRRGSASR